MIQTLISSIIYIKHIFTILHGKVEFGGVHSEVCTVLTGWWLNKLLVSDDDNLLVTKDFHAGCVAGSQNSD